MLYSLTLKENKARCTSQEVVFKHEDRDSNYEAHAPAVFVNLAVGTTHHGDICGSLLSINKYYMYRSISKHCKIKKILPSSKKTVTTIRCEGS